ncbi:MAG: restriction endonuclease [Betaproteobacteria bacterium]|nr:restriction endonuclease [Betaproteobacteria bacterium]
MSTYSLQDIDLMVPLEFERWAIRAMGVAGYRVWGARVTGDAGADGICTKGNMSVIVQCKHTNYPDRAAPIQAVQDLIRAREAYSLPGKLKLVALTNAERFPDEAAEIARQNGIVLVGRKNLLDWIEYSDL